MKNISKKNQVSIIGAGSWGTTLAVVLAKKGLNVTLHSVFKEHNLSMESKRENAEFLKGVKFPQSLSTQLSLTKTLSNNIILIAVPVKYIRGVLKKIEKSKISLNNKIFLSVSKGIESKSLKRVSEIIEEEVGEVKVAVLSGPNIAREVLLGIPTTSLIACKDEKIVKMLQGLLTTPTFRIYAQTDVIGVELGGALKNIIAIACGIADGLGYGTNTKAALVTRGILEIIRLGKRLGANPETFWGISGLGDLVTTCFSPHSRNRTVGEEIGSGKKVCLVTKKMEMVAEGVETVKSAYRLSKKFKVEMPITQEVYKVIYQNKPPKKAVNDLMIRPLKMESRQ